jgi:hypothetical protein
MRPRWCMRVVLCVTLPCNVTVCDTHAVCVSGVCAFQLLTKAVEASLLSLVATGSGWSQRGEPQETSIA